MEKKGEGTYFRDPDEAIMAFENHDVDIHAKIFVRITKEINGEMKNKEDRDKCWKNYL